MNAVFFRLSPNKNRYFVSTANDGSAPAYAGLSGFPGLFQVVFAVPSDLADGDYETVLTIAGVASPGATFVPVRR